jgi:hypothetical protein
MIFRFRYEKRPESDYYADINELVKRTQVKPDTVLAFMKEKGYLIEVEGMLIPDFRFLTHYRYLNLPPRPLARATWIDYIARELGINEPSARQCFDYLRERGWIELVRIYIEGRWVTLFRRTVLRAIVPWGGLAEIEIKIYRFQKCFEYQSAVPRKVYVAGEFRIWVYWFEKKLEFTRKFMDDLLEQVMDEVFYTFPDAEAMGKARMVPAYEDHEVDFTEPKQVPDSRHVEIIIRKKGEIHYHEVDEGVKKKWGKYLKEKRTRLWEWLR